MSSGASSEGDAGGVDVRIVSRTASDLEVAAVTAVLRGVLEEESGLETEPDAAPSAWQRSARGLRSPIAPGPGRWRSFSG